LSPIYNATTSEAQSFLVFDSDLEHRVLVVQVVPITNAEVKKRIHQTYRMGYIKDVILPRVGDPQNTEICLFQWL